VRPRFRPRRRTSVLIINLGEGGGLTERVIQLIAFITVLSLAPSILVMMTRSRAS